MKNSNSQNKFLLLFLILAGLAAVLWAVGRYTGASVPPLALLIVRWAALLAFCGYAFARRSLTAWIFAGMIVGTSIGHDWPNVARNLQVLSSIFLNLIRTIVAPLIFSTLVVGIAGHADLKQVGRMGIKALIYFEVVTTLALLIGLAAINISQAGAGVQVPPPPPGETLKTQRLTPSEMLLHAFPENVAKAVADGQVLQIVVFS